MAGTRDIDKCAREYALVLEDIFHEEGWSVVELADKTERGEWDLWVEPPRVPGFGRPYGVRIYVKCSPRGEQHDELTVFGVTRALAAEVLDRRLGGAASREEIRSDVADVFVRTGRR